MVLIDARAAIIDPALLRDFVRRRSSLG